MGCCFKCIKRALFALFIIAILVAIIHVWLKSKKYVFSEKAVSDVAKKHVISGSGKPCTN